MHMKQNLSWRWPPKAQMKAKAKVVMTRPVSLAARPELCLLLKELTDCRCFWFIICTARSSSSSRKICLSRKRSHLQHCTNIRSKRDIDSDNDPLSRCSELAAHSQHSAYIPCISPPTIPLRHTIT